MTSAENERLAVVETKVDNLVVTTSALDGKVDAILTYITQQQTIENARREAGQFRRWMVPILVTVVNGMIAALSLALRVIHT